MDRYRLLRIRALVMHADSTMNAIPRPVPPRAPRDWEGDILDAEGLYEMYNRLPDDLQAVAGPGYGLCMEALERQHDAALCALSARYLLFQNILEGTGLGVDDLVPDGNPDPYLSLVGDPVDDDERPDPGPDERDPPASHAREDSGAVIYLDELRGLESGAGADDADEVLADTADEPADTAERERISRRLCWHGAAAAVVVAATSLVLLVWLTTRTPTPAFAPAPAPAAHTLCIESPHPG